ncbi:putative repeat protein (TIGR01451 family) [Paenibacillus endophyticus]|uniref:Putative repeat protein (TIGR01451 family) n=1 Tax=Paenibacillus endophyticus TaxID=1294268 RepID=A0A7W5C5M4_9BACL|nr:DUF11 domain-containing protein [Paenibacillus endophyticus]MBB3151357.1 putative repeat protein (TIGR01451 family) [Paenibacillus endophyticus]
MSPSPAGNPMLQNQSFVQFASGSVELVTYSNTVNTALIGTQVAIVKRAFESEALLGSTITYELLLTNNGNVTGTVTLTDKLPEGTAFVANSVLLNGAPAPGANPDIGIAVGNLAPLASARVVFQLIVVSIPATLQLVNQARADAVFQTAEGRSITSSTYSNTLVTPVNALSLYARLRASTNQTFVSDYVTYELTVVNDGNLSLRDAFAFINLPVGVLFVPGSVTINGIITPGADPRSGFPLGTLRPNSTVIVTYRTQTTDQTEYVSISQATIRYLLNGAQTYTESNEVSVILIKPEILINKQVDQTIAVPGDILLYSVAIRNAQTTAVDAVLEDILPAGILFMANSLKLNGIPQPGASFEDGVNLGTLLGNSQTIVTFAAKIPLQLASTAPLINSAKVAYTFRLADGRVVGNTSLSNTVATAVAAPVIQLTGSVMPPVVEYGDTITVRSVLMNKGNLAAVVYFTSDFPFGVDLLPRTYRVDGARLGPEAYDGNRTWYLGSVPPGASLQIVYSAIVTDAILSDDVIGYVRARFTYDAGGRSFSGEASSNVLEVTVTGDDE